MYRFMAESGCKCKSLSIHRPDTSGYLMYHTSNLCIIHQILCIGTISSDTSCIIHQILDVYLHLHPDERLAPNFAIHGAIHILYSDTAYTAIHGDTAYRMYHPPSGQEVSLSSAALPVPSRCRILLHSDYRAKMPSSDTSQTR